MVLGTDIFSVMVVLKLVTDSRSITIKPLPGTPIGGTGDPKFTAFDGSKFYFHGLHSHRCVIHAASHGEMLVSKMRATSELCLGVNRTEFE